MSLQKLERFRWFIIGFFAAILSMVIILVLTLVFYL